MALSAGGALHPRCQRELKTESCPALFLVKMCYGPEVQAGVAIAMPQSSQDAHDKSAVGALVRLCGLSREEAEALIAEEEAEGSDDEDGPEQVSGPLHDTSIVTAQSKPAAPPTIPLAPITAAFPTS